MTLITEARPIKPVEETQGSAATAIPPIPEGLCGISGCVFTKGHESRGNDLTTDQELHTWEVFRPSLRLTPDIT